MDIPVTDIHRFFEKKCTEAEAARIAAYLSQHPEALNGWFAQEWNETEALTQEEYELLRDELLLEVEKPVRRKIIPMKWISVAAAAVLLIAVSLYLLPSNSAVQLTVMAQAKQSKVEKRTTGQWVLRTNLSKKPGSILLEDGSVVSMQPGAFIRYLPFAEVRARDIELNGEAFFKVAKDTNKPFTVVAGGIATTALGTQFTVQEKTESIIVRLHEGKVKIRAKGALQEKWNGEVYLKPGEEFTFDKTNSTYTVKEIPRENKEDAAALTRERKPVMVSAGDWYMFNNQGLADVFVQLEELYNVDIEYDSKYFRNVYFIGKFEKTDSLEHILENIAVLKKMKVRRKGDRYVITKK